MLDRGLDLAESARHTMASARPQQNGGAGRPMPVSLTAGPDPGLRPGPEAAVGADREGEGDDGEGCD